jgi:hypothetical protein
LLLLLLLLRLLRAVARRRASCQVVGDFHGCSAAMLLSLLLMLLVRLECRRGSSARGWRRLGHGQRQHLRQRCRRLHRRAQPLRERH